MNTQPATQVSPRPRSSVSTPKAPYCKALAIDPAALARGRIEREAKLAAWRALDLDADTRLRQKWADEGFMREGLRSAGVRIGSDLEPATPSRLRSVLRRAGFVGDVVGTAIGCSLERFLQLNPRLPLWAAVALVLEAVTS
jgi:hypothetical protein